jgi:L-serine dehydratase
MAIAGLKRAIPPDEVIDSMRRIGHELPACLKETGRGGLATTPTGDEIARRLK